MTYRKSRREPPADKRAISAKLRRASELLTTDDTAAALTELNVIALADRGPAIRSQVAALAAKSEAAQGRFTAAASAYDRAETLAPADGDTWLSPALGQVRSLLRAVEVDTAQEHATATLAKAEKRWAEYEKAAGRAATTLRQGATFTVEARPPRPSVVAFRLGQQFWQEGEPDTAAFYYAESLRIEPDGATRARIELARLALLNEDPATALDLARQALNLGQFHAKTLSAWPIAIAAARALGTPDLTDQLARGLAQATPTVRGRARLGIARALRESGDPTWENFANPGPREDPRHILAAEFGKMKLASAVQAGRGTRHLVRLATDLAATPNLAPREWLGAAKAIVTARLADEKNPSISGLLTKGTATYGPAATNELALGLATACLDAQRPDLATPLLRDIIRDNVGDATWSRATWTAARTLKADGDLEPAAKLFDRLARRAEVPERFRLTARLEWLRTVVASGNLDALAGAREEILTAARRLDDFELLLDLARQMTLAPAEIATAAEEVFDRGERLARRAFQAAALPADAATIAFKLFRRQSDFGRFAAITSAWEEIPEKKKLWLWSPQAALWEAIALVATAYRAQGAPTAATTLVDLHLTDPATPPEALAIIGIPEALATLYAGDLPTALDELTWIANQAPTHPLSAYAHYWFALRDQQSGRPIAQHLQAIHLALGESPSLSWQRDLTARANLLTANLNLEKTTSPYPKEVLTTQLATIKEDLARW